MTKVKKYWKGLAELNNDPIVEKLSQNEFVEDIPVDDFLGDPDYKKSDHYLCATPKCFKQMLEAIKPNFKAN